MKSLTKMDKPIVRKYSEQDWEFIHPPLIDNGEVYAEYWEGVEFLNHDDKKAEKIFKKLIARYPFYIDAYNHLSIAFRNQNKVFESLLTAEKSYRIGKECLPPKFDAKKDKLIWPNLDNRPFLRACQIFAMECQAHGDYATAIEVYKENLMLNEEDHQGIRYLLLEVYFLTEDYENARVLLDKYRNDFSIEFKFGNVALYVLEDNLKQADESLEEAVRANKFFVDEVVKTKHVAPPPYRIPHEPHFDAGIPVRSVQEAYEYWKRNEALYKNKKVIRYFKEKQKQTAQM